MSPENFPTVKPSLFRIGEGCQDWTKVNPAQSGRDLNDGLSSHRHGVVGADGMSAQVLALMEEICVDELPGSTADPSGQRREVRPVEAEVGAVHSSDEAANHRGAKGPHLVNANSEAKDRR
jgi:hypothetical protein